MAAQSIVLPILRGERMPNICEICTEADKDLKVADAAPANPALRIQDAVQINGKQFRFDFRLQCLEGNLCQDHFMEVLESLDLKATAEKADAAATKENKTD